jgi:hypothetical protein
MQRINAIDFSESALHKVPIMAHHHLSIFFFIMPFFVILSGGDNALKKKFTIMVKTIIYL